MTAVVGLVGKLRQLSLAMMKRGLDDWSQMAALSVETTDAKVQNVGKRDQLEKMIPGPVILIETRVDGRVTGPCFFVFPVAMAANAAGKFVLLPDNAIAAKMKNGLDEADLEAFREMANLLCGSSNNALTQLVQGVRLSQSVDALRVQQALPGVAGLFDRLPEADIAAVALSVKLEGQAYTVHHLMPLALARTMLG
ncbi:MAG: hypothetical protein JNL08_02505 [Planctomycetes bacterium]|nr:hypothetical protein [Planctomycetota bacterium]